MGSKENVRIKLVSGANQMSLIRDTEEVIKFLEFVGRKSILNEHAVNCRLTACHNVFAVVEEQEDSVDYMLQNLDLFINRFRNKNTNVQASTLKVYKSRVKSSLEDYKQWSADPFAWERSLTDKAKQVVHEGRRGEKKNTQPTAPKNEKKRKKAVESKTSQAPVEETPLAPEQSRRTVSFPLRSGFNLEMHLPADGITVKELQKLCLFLYPYCSDMDLDNMPWLAFQPQKLN